MSSIIWCNYVIIICVIIALHAMQLLHERNNERTIFASKCGALKLEDSWDNWNRCKLHSQIIQCALDRLNSFLQLWKVSNELYNLMFYLLSYDETRWCASTATTARSHYIKNIVLKFLKVRFESLATFFFENSNLSLIRTNTNRLSSLIHWSRILSISRSITRKIKICSYRKFLFFSLVVFDNFFIFISSK